MMPCDCVAAGIKGEEKNEFFRVLSGILLLGNIEFKGDDKVRLSLPSYPSPPAPHVSLGSSSRYRMTPSNVSP